MFFTFSTFSHAIMGLLAFLGQFPTSYGWLSLAFFLFVTVTISIGNRVVYNLYFHPLAKFPGPWYAVISEFFFSYNIISGSSHLRMRALHEKYGDVVRVAPGELSFASVGSWKDVYMQRKSGAIFPKDPRFLITDDTLRAPHLVSTTDIENHAVAKKVLSHAFAPKELLDQEHIIHKYVDMFAVAIAEESRKGPLNFTEWYQWVTADVLGDLCFGEPFGSVEARKTNPWVATVVNSVIFVAWDCAIGHISPLLEKSIWYIAPPSIRKSALNHYAQSRAKIQARIARGEGERKDFCSYIFELRDQLDLNDWHVASYSQAMIVAGSETSATTMTILTYWLCKTPLVYEKLKQEIRSRYASSHEITSQNTTFLPYLTAVINEILRLVPPMSFGSPRVIPEGGETVDGHFVPGGTFVSVHGYVTARSAKYFKDPDAFIPERWLDPEGTDNLAASSPFLLGPGLCLGINMAWMELRILIAKMVFWFDFELAGDNSGWEHLQNYILWKKPALWVNVRTRDVT
ncbi:cytochrome P450 [Hyaloscypha variabilis F]|uniref:Cytochrome P450 n=1 Tax=Hyaloscypha variabilis (strain UAMH 11265 / GT02V1 / F) TaxID=1149755 RepID=A0A2J6RM54_HYAVF|nr:cytochrome P450 [Hyaloscypha variabilis F]